LELDPLVKSIYGATLDPGALPDVLTGIAGRFAAADAALYWGDGPKGPIAGFVNGRLPPEINLSYVRDYAHLDTQILRLFDQDAEGFLTGADFFDEEGEVGRCPVHNEFMVPNGIDAQLVWSFRIGSVPYTFVLMRSGRVGAFDEEARRQGAALVPHLKQSLQIGRRLAAVTPGWVTAALEKLPLPVLLLDRRRHLLFANAAGDRLLREGRLLSVRGSVVSPRQADARNPFDALLEKAAAGAAGQMAIATGEALESLRLLQAAPLPDADGDNRILLTVQKEEPQAALSIESVMARFELTRAEGRLACHLARGGSLKTFAQEQRVSIHTARNQVKAIFAKTGTNRQGALVALLRSKGQLTGD
jgi:DNA-binding CsgD family transcriptional regulator